MKVLSLAVDGLERANAEGVLTWAFQQDADVICFQDTRCSEYSLPSNDFFPEHYHAYFADNYDDAKVNGVAVYCKKMPKAIMFGLGFMDFDHLGIYIQADYDDCSIGSIMVPPAVGDRGDKDLKMRFLQQLGAHLQKVRNKKRDFILCGGWELAWQPRDAEESGNRLDIPGFSNEERDWLGSLYSTGYSDAFREVESDADHYTWWPDGDESPGVRTDTHIISDSLAPHVTNAVIESEEAFSSHAAVTIEYDIEL